MDMFHWFCFIWIAFESLSFICTLKTLFEISIMFFRKIWDSLSGRWEVFHLVKSWDIVLYAKYHHFNFISFYFVKNVFLVFPVWFLGDLQFCNNISTIQTENSIDNISTENSWDFFTTNCKTTGSNHLPYLYSLKSNL